MNRRCAQQEKQGFAELVHVAFNYDNFEVNRGKILAEKMLAALVAIVEVDRMLTLLLGELETFFQQFEIVISFKNFDGFGLGTRFIQK